MNAHILRVKDASDNTYTFSRLYSTEIPRLKLCLKHEKPVVYDEPACPACKVTDELTNPHERG